MQMDAAVKIAATVTGQSAVDGLKKSLDGVSNSVEGVTGKFAGLAGSVKMLAGALGVMAFGTMVKDVINLGDELFKMSQKTGVSVEALSTFRMAGKLADVSLEDLAKALVKFDVSISKATTGSKEVAGAFAAIGISVATLKGLKPEDAMLRVADAFAKVPDGADKTRVAVELFGKAGAGMIPLLNMGSDAIEAFGVKMTTDFASRAEAFNDQLTMMGTKVKAFAIQAAQSMLPVLQELGTEILKLVDTKPDMIGFFDAIGEGARLLTLGVVSLYQGLATLVDMAITAARQGASLLTGDLAAAASLGEQFADRAKARLDETARMAAALTKNSLIFGEGTVGEIKARRDSSTAIPSRTTTGRIDSSTMDRSKDTEAEREKRRLENAIKQYEAETGKIRAETAALGESAMMRKEILALQDLEAKGIKVGTDAYNKLKENRLEALRTQYDAERTFQVGMKQGFNDYIENATNAGKAMKDALSHAFKGAEDALVSFVMTGKLEFKSFITSILSDIARMIIQQTIMAPIVASLKAMMFSANGNVFSGGTVQAFATGGVVSGPTMFPMRNGGVGVMGEAGPEAIMPLQRDSSGRLGVKSAGGSGGGTSVVVNVDARGDSNVQGDEEKSRQLGRAITSAVQAELVRQKRPGGLLAMA